MAINQWLHSFSKDFFDFVSTFLHLVRPLFPRQPVSDHLCLPLFEIKDERFLQTHIALDGKLIFIIVTMRMLLTMSQRFTMEVTLVGERSTRYVKPKREEGERSKFKKKKTEEELFTEE